MRAALSLLAALLMLALVAVDSAATHPVPRYRIDYGGGGLGVFGDEKLVLSQLGDRWFVERRSWSKNWCGDQRGGRCAATGHAARDWIDGTRCASLHPALARIEAVWSSDPAVTDEQSPIMVADGVMFMIQRLPAQKDGPPSGLLYEFFGPTVDWWRETTKAIASCWTSDAPKIRGRRLQPTLTAD